MWLCAWSIVSMKWSIFVIRQFNSKCVYCQWTKKRRKQTVKLNSSSSQLYLKKRLGVKWSSTQNKGVIGHSARVLWITRSHLAKKLTAKTARIARKCQEIFWIKEKIIIFYVYFSFGFFSLKIAPMNAYKLRNEINWCAHRLGYHMQKCEPNMQLLLGCNDFF